MQVHVHYNFYLLKNNNICTWTLDCGGYYRFIFDFQTMERYSTLEMDAESVKDCLATLKVIIIIIIKICYNDNYVAADSFLLLILFPWKQ